MVTPLLLVNVGPHSALKSAVRQAEQLPELRGDGIAFLCRVPPTDLSRLGTWTLAPLTADSTEQHRLFETPFCAPGVKAVTPISKASRSAANTTSNCHRPRISQIFAPTPWMHGRKHEVPSRYVAPEFSQLLLRDPGLEVRPKAQGSVRTRLIGTGRSHAGNQLQDASLTDQQDISMLYPAMFLRARFGFRCFATPLRTHTPVPPEDIYGIGLPILAPNLEWHRRPLDSCQSDGF